MNRKEIDALLNEAILISQEVYCDGGLQYELLQVSQQSNLLDECKQAHEAFRNRGYKLTKISEISENELKETLEDYFLKPLKKKNKTYSQKILNNLNVNLAPFVPYVWDADFGGYGKALVIAIESEQGNIVLLMDWTID